jgi:hypothetical protein
VPDGFSEWEFTKREYTDDGYVFSVSGHEIFKICQWVRNFRYEKRRYREQRELCWKCEHQECGGSNCGFYINRRQMTGALERRRGTNAELRVTALFAFSDGHPGVDPESANSGFCKNPWTNISQLVTW